MDRQLISQWFAYVRPMYWPVLCLEIMKLYLWAWADAETHGVARQFIVAVNDHGRIRVTFIEDAPGDDWRAQLAAFSATASKLRTSSPFDLIEGPISDAVSACLKRSQSLSRTLSSNPCELATAGFAPQRPILDPG